MDKILIIEDEVNICDTISDILELSGYKVFTAHDGESGLESLVKNKPDLVLCDVNMPKLNGFEVLKIARSILNRDELPPFIYLTAKVERSSMREGMSLGADDYITKPCSSKEILEVIRTRLSDRIDLKSKLIQHERVRIGSELHNGVQSFLVAAHMGVRTVNKKMQNLKLSERELLSSTEQLLMQAIEETRTLSHTLIPENLEKNGICEYLRLLIESLGTTENIKFNFNCVLSGRAEKHTELLVSRLIQELICNSIKHAKASLISINISEHETNEIIILYSDNGIGFDMTKIVKGVGIAELPKLVESIGGEIDIKSKVGRGFSCLVALPCMAK